MRRFTVILFALLLVGVVGAFGWWYLFGRSSSGGSASAAIPTVAGPCPETNDLAGIEGWAPGAGNAEKGANNERAAMGGFGSAIGGSTETPTPAPTGKCRQLAPQVDTYFKQLATAKTLVPTDTFDPVKRGAELPSDAASLTTWVRDHIRTDVYPGAMRGAAGTLQAKAGSSADKSLLLAKLLGEKNIEFRFMHVILSDDDASRVVAEWKAGAAQPVAPTWDPNVAFAQLGIDRNTAMSQVTAAAGAARTRTTDVLTRAKAPVSNMLSLLQAAGAKVGTDDTERVALDGARDHWYVQANIGGTWTDEDPSVRDLQPGTHLGQNPEEPVSEIPEGVRMPVTIALYADPLGAEAATPLAEVSVPMTELDAEPIRITLTDHTLTTNGKSPESGTFTATLQAGKEEKSGEPFTLDNVAGGQLADVRVRITVTPQGRAPYVYDRVLVDRRTADGRSISPDWNARRTATALNFECDGLALAGDLDDAFVALRNMDEAQRFGALMAYAVAGGNGTQKPPRDAAQTYPTEAMRYFRQDLLARSVLESSGTRFFFDRPMIALVVHGLRDDGGKIATYTKFDVVENAMQATGANAAQANMQRGFYDTVAEQNVLTQPSHLNTLAVFDAVEKQHGSVHVVQQDATMGQLAIAPTQSVSLDGAPVRGWWQIDPATGSMIGRMQGGAGQAMEEYVTTLNDASSMWTAISFYADVMRCIAVGVTNPLAGVTGEAAQNAVLNCFANAACAALESIAYGEYFTHEDADLQALAYNILDLSFNTHVDGGSKDSWSPWGVACNKLFPSDSNNWSWSGSYG